MEWRGHRIAHFGILCRAKIGKETTPPDPSTPPGRRSRRTPRRQPWLSSHLWSLRAQAGARASPSPLRDGSCRSLRAWPGGGNKGAEAGLATLGRRLEKAAMARKNTPSPSLSQRATVSPNQVQPSPPLLATVLLSHAHLSLLRRRARLLAAQALLAFVAGQGGPNERTDGTRPAKSPLLVVSSLAPHPPFRRCVGGHRRRSCPVVQRHRVTLRCSGKARHHTPPNPTARVPRRLKLPA